MHTRVVTDPAGQRWVVDVSAPGSTDDAAGTRWGWIASMFASGLRGWRVCIYRIDTDDKWSGPVQRVKAADEAEARREAGEIVRSLEGGTSPYLRDP